MFSMDCSFWRYKVYADILACSPNFYENVRHAYVFWALVSFWLFVQSTKNMVPILWHGPFWIRWPGAGCSKEQWWLWKLINFALHGVVCYCTNFLLLYSANAPYVMYLAYVVLLKNLVWFVMYNFAVLTCAFVSICSSSDALIVFCCWCLLCLGGNVYSLITITSSLESTSRFILSALYFSDSPFMHVGSSYLSQHLSVFHFNFKTDVFDKSFPPSRRSWIRDFHLSGSSVFLSGWPLVWKVWKYRGKYCQGKLFILNFTFGPTSVFSSIVGRAARSTRVLTPEITRAFFLRLEYSLNSTSGWKFPLLVSILQIKLLICCHLCKFGLCNLYLN